MTTPHRLRRSSAHTRRHTAGSAQRHVATEVTRAGLEAEDGPPARGRAAQPPGPAALDDGHAEAAACGLSLGEQLLKIVVFPRGVDLVAVVAGIVEAGEAEAGDASSQVVDDGAQLGRCLRPTRPCCGPPRDDDGSDGEREGEGYRAPG